MLRIAFASFAVGQAFRMVHDEADALFNDAAGADAEVASAVWQEEWCEENGVSDKCSDFVAALAAGDCPLVNTKDVAYTQNLARKKCQNLARDLGKAKAAATPVGRKIAGATKKCMADAEEVCVKSTCPTICAQRDDKDCDCRKKCSTTFSEMWKTGDIVCDEKETWEKCQANLEKKLREQGRDKALEAISREHFLKCVCVNTKDGDNLDTCYEGSHGIERGQKWCDYCDTPSVRKLFSGKCKWTPAPSC